MVMCHLLSHAPRDRVESVRGQESTPALNPPRQLSPRSSSPPDPRALISKFSFSSGISKKSQYYSSGERTRVVSLRHSRFSGELSRILLFLTQNPLTPRRGDPKGLEPEPRVCGSVTPQRSRWPAADICMCYR